MDLARLETTVQGFYSQGLARSTNRTYESAKRRFLNFCSLTSLPPVPASEAVLCLYASHLAKEGLRHQSIRTYLSALRHLYISLGHPDPFAHNQFPRLSYVLKGIHRSEGASRPQDRRLPILPSTLEALWGVWSVPSPNISPFECSMLWAACCIGFFAFLRSGEFTSTPTQEVPLRPEDVAVDNHSNPSYMSIRLRHSKTDPFGNGVTLFVGRTYQHICPVAAVLAYLAVRPPIRGPLFIHANGTPLTRVELIRHVRQALRLRGFDVSNYSGHSFRIGAATTAAARGIPDATIKMLGRWESSAYTSYIRTPREQLAGIARTMLGEPITPSNN